MANGTGCNNIRIKDERTTYFVAKKNLELPPTPSHVEAFKRSLEGKNRFQKQILNVLEVTTQQSRWIPGYYSLDSVIHQDLEVREVFKNRYEPELDIGIWIHAQAIRVYDKDKPERYDKIPCTSILSLWVHAS